jgi:hypothetical protein
VSVYGFLSMLYLVRAGSDDVVISSKVVCSHV